jgi:hypothetical protein
MKVWQFLAASAVLHALLITCLWSFEHEVAKKAEPLEFELKVDSSKASVHKDSALASARPPRRQSSSAKPASQTLSNNLQTFLRQPSNSARSAAQAEEAGAPAAPLAHSGRWDEGGYTTKDDPTVAWGAGSGTFERIQDLVLMKKFQQKIDALLFYPGVLARRKISGIVNSRIVLNQAGDCDWRHTRIEAANPYLRVYILHLLKKVCSENFKKYTHAREMTNIDMSFKFEISEDRTSDELIAENQSVLGNVLIFYRQSRNSIAEWRLGPLTGMFPIPLCGFGLSMDRRAL